MLQKRPPCCRLEKAVCLHKLRNSPTYGILPVVDGENSVFDQDCIIVVHLLIQGVENEYLNLSDLAKEPANKQVQALTLCFSQETVTIVKNLGLTDEQ